MIKELLGTGKAEAMTAEELSRITGLTPRAIRAQITRERDAGALICSTARAPGGYYLPETEAEIFEFVRLEHSRARTASRIERRFKAALAKHNVEQITLFDGPQKGGG